MAETGLSRASKARLKRDFQLLSLESKDKRAIVKQSLQEIRKESLKNKTKQQTPDGKKWTPRQKAKTNAKGKSVKMLRKIYGYSRVDLDGSMNGKLHYRSPVQRRIATEHHYGLVPKQAKQTEKPKGAMMATAEQATALIEAGINSKISKHYPAKGKKRSEQHKNALLWAALRSKCKARGMINANDILKNLTFGEAGALLRVLNETQGKQRQRNKALPARPALNENPAHNAKITEKLIVERLPK